MRTFDLADLRSNAIAQFGNNFVPVVQHLTKPCWSEGIHIVFGQSLFFDLFGRGYRIWVAMAACRAGSRSREVAQPMAAVLDVCVMEEVRSGANHRVGVFLAKSNKMQEQRFSFRELKAACGSCRDYSRLFHPSLMRNYCEVNMRKAPASFVLHRMIQHLSSGNGKSASETLDVK